MYKDTEQISSIATQVAGSCNLSGIKVTSQDMVVMEKIISGELSPQAIRQRLVQEYKIKNGIASRQEQA